MLRNRLDIQLRNVCLILRVYGWLQSLWNIQLSQGTGQGVSMTFNAASRLRSLEDRRAALGSSRWSCHTPGVGGLSRRLLNRATPYVAAAGHSPSSAMGQTAVPPTPLHRTSVSPRALLGTLSFRRRVFAGNPHHRRGFPVPQAAPPKSIMSTVLPNTNFPKSKERMLGCWGVPEAGIRARIMSISRALGAEKPAAKRPRSCMDGPCGRKLSIMSTVLPNTPSQKSKEQILSFLGGT